MNKIIYTIIGGVIACLFAACEAEHPGYLFSSEAAYPIDSLVVLTPASQQQTLAAMQEIKKNFEKTEEGKILFQKKTELQTQLANLQVQSNELQEKMWDLEDAAYDAEDAGNFDEADLLWEEREKVRQQKKAIDNTAWGIKYEQIPEIEEQIEAAIGNIESEIVLMQRRLDKNVAYTSSVIDKIKGTAPLIYSIAEIKVPDEGDADKFTDYVSVMGGGRFIVEWDENIPVGRYIISLYIENEGWKDLLPEAFTIIVK